MTYYYSASKNSFYLAAMRSHYVRSGTWPSDAIEVSDDVFQEFSVDTPPEGMQRAPDAVGLPRWVEQEKLTQDQIWNLIKAERDRRTQNGGFQVGDYWFHSDQFSRTQQLGLVQLGEAIPAGLQWKTMSGEFVTMTPELARQVLEAAAAQEQRIFAVAEQHRMAMEASAEPWNYDYSSGWPLTYDEATHS